MYLISSKPVELESEIGFMSSPERATVCTTCKKHKINMLARLDKCVYETNWRARAGQGRAGHGRGGDKNY